MHPPSTIAFFPGSRSGTGSNPGQSNYHSISHNSSSPYCTIYQLCHSSPGTPGLGCMFALILTEVALFQRHHSLFWLAYISRSPPSHLVLCCTSVPQIHFVPYVTFSNPYLDSCRPLTLPSFLHSQDSVLFLLQQHTLLDHNVSTSSFVLSAAGIFTSIGAFLHGSAVRYHLSSGFTRQSREAEKGCQLQGVLEAL